MIFIPVPDDDDCDDVDVDDDVVGGKWLFVFADRSVGWWWLSFRCNEWKKKNTNNKLNAPRMFSPNENL